MQFILHPMYINCKFSFALQVTEDTEGLRFNTAISAMMEFVNGAFKWGSLPRSVAEPFVLLLSPYAPHLAEELWQVSPWSSDGPSYNRSQGWG